MKLSPKALRYAQHAAWAAVANRSFWSERDAVWTEAANAPRQDGYVEVSPRLARLFLSAIEEVVAVAETDANRAEIDPDAGNDIEFLRVVAKSLETELQEASRAALVNGANAA